MPKQIITIQLDPMTVAKVWQYAKDQGLPKQVAYEKLIELGFKYETENKTQNQI